MTPSNPSNNQPFIFRILDSLGIPHQVVPVDHSHNILVGQTVSLIINGTEVEIELADVPNLIRALADPDSTPTDDSTKLVTSGGVKAALDGKQNTLTFDSTPTANSTNPVTSGGVKAALDEKQNTLTFDSTPTANSTNPVTSGGVKAAIDAASADPMPIIRGLSGGDSVDLDEALTQPNTMARFIILNEYGNDYALPLWDIFYSNTLPVHKSGSENDELPNGEYLLATVFRINSSEHEHQNCYFVSFDSIFSE